MITEVEVAEGADGVRRHQMVVNYCGGRLTSHFDLICEET